MNEDFLIRPDLGPVSAHFLQRNISGLDAAAAFVKALPYRRNTDKEDSFILFRDGYGTCSTKHALLRRLSAEQGWDGVQLYQGIFKMNRINTPRVIPVLDAHSLPYIPEAHNYLKIKNAILDCTNARSSAADFAGELMDEIRVGPDQVTTFKVQYHKRFLEKWLAKTEYPYSLERLWAIREECIAALSV